ncbi:MAG: extracellular solute-binding protein [Burkholderiaceae bacterium]|nr:extracellular solute-binding protein [Burkholderiaceae bacterium]
MRLFKRVLQSTALLALIAGGASVWADEIVIAANGGTMREAREDFYYKPFAKKTGTNVIPFDIEIYDQWARVKAMQRTGKIEFDIVNASAADLILHRDVLAPMNCAALPNVKKALPGACDPYAMSSHAGALVLMYNKDVFKGKAPKTWADFWDVKTFPGPRALPDSGDRAWWVPAAALLADGVKKQDLWPLDLDRAYRKMDQIKPNINVWWKTAAQMMQIVREKEVVMTMGFTGRAFTAIQDGAPFDISWEGALHDQGYLAVLKDAPNRKKAIEFLDFMIGDVDGQVKFMNKIHYSTFTQASLDKVPAADLKFYATVPENAAKVVRPDWEWIAKNQSMLNDRFNKWITR